MVSLSVVIMAHPSRREAAEALSASLAAPIIWDRGLGIWDTARRAWHSVEPGATHHVVVQDDALPVADFREHATAALTARPDALVSHFLGRGIVRIQFEAYKATREADRVGAAWIGMPWAFGVTMSAPVARLPDLFEVADTFTGDGDDARLSRAARRLGIPILATWPSLVDHDDVPSLHIPVAVPRRFAWRTGVPASWDTPVVPLYP